MSELSFFEKLKVVLFETFYSCKLFGHQFKFEPMPGDEPPFEFHNCAHCGAPNPRFSEYE